MQELLETPKNGKVPKILSLSGTPYNLLGQYEENVYTWDYVMEQRRKKEFMEQYPDLHNPYADLPEMRIYTFDLSKEIPTAYRYETEDMAFNFREFFRTWTGDPEQDFHPIPEGVHKGDFVHKADVRSFLDLITQESEDSHYPFSNEEYRGVFCFLGSQTTPYFTRSSCGLLRCLHPYLLLAVPIIICFPQQLLYKNYCF